MLKVRGLDHIVLVVENIERSLDWYTSKLGMVPVRVDEWRAGEAPFPSVRVDDGTIIDLIPTGGIAVSGRGNVDHFCLVIERVDFAALDGFEVVDGPGTRYGARGNGTSLYVKDPDGNTVELRYYDEG